jgi:hypothetical protein
VFFLCLFGFLLEGLGLNLGLHACSAGYHLSHTSAHFAVIILEMGRVSRTICLGWPQTAVFLISASQVARITGVSHFHLSCCFLFCFITHLKLGSLGAREIKFQSFSFPSIVFHLNKAFLFLVTPLCFSFSY